VPVIRNATALLVNVSVTLNVAIIAIVPMASFALNMKAVRFVNACVHCLHLAILTATHPGGNGWLLLL
jgi:hypothetical protein